MEARDKIEEKREKLNLYRAVTVDECLRWNTEKDECSIRFGVKCRCSSFVDDPEVILKELDDMLIYNKENSKTVAALRKERRELIQKYNLRPDNIQDVYEEDKRRGSGGGHSEGDTSNSAASMKQKMKDNRPVETKNTAAQRAAIKEATKEWEEENGRLPKLARSSMGRSKTDTYTGEPLK